MKSLKPHFSVSSPQLSSNFLSNSTFNFRKYPLNFDYRVFKYNNNIVNPISSSSSSSSSSSTSKVSSTPHYVQPSSSSLMVSGVGPSGFQDPYWNSPPGEELLEKAIYRCRFVTFLGVFGSLIGSLLCYIKGCSIVAASFIEYFSQSGRVIVSLVEAIDVYLLGTVMLIFGMGLYELFVSNLDIAKAQSSRNKQHRSNLFGLFTLMERPKWLEIKSVNELKTKVGHVIVMLLMIGLFDNSKKAAINTPTDLLCFAASVLLCSGCLYMLSKLNGSH